MVSGASKSTEEVIDDVLAVGVAVMTVMVLSALLPGVEGPMIIVVLEITMTEVLGIVGFELDLELERELNKLVPGDASTGPRVGLLLVKLEREVVVNPELARDDEDKVDSEAARELDEEAARELDKEAARELDEDAARELDLLLDRLLDSIEDEVAEKVEAVPLLVNVVVVTSTPVVIVYDVEELVLFGAQEGQHGST